MQLVSLDIANFRVIRKAHLEFPDQIIGFIGPNGAGKSSIIEAISWALYGNQVARSGKEEIKSTFASPLNDCVVDLTFLVHDQAYRVVRKLAGKSERAEVELYRDNRPESVGSMETKGYIGQLLGLDWRGFLTSFLARQSELNALSDLQPSKRREHLAGMLGIERLDKAMQKVKEDTRIAGEKATFIERQLISRDQLTGQINDLTARTAELVTEVDRISGARDTAKSSFEKLDSVLREHETKRASCSRIQAQLDALAKNHAQLSEQKTLLTGQLAEIQSAETEIKSLEPSLARLPQVKTEVEKLRDARTRAAHRAELQRQVGELESQIKTAGEKLRTIDNALAQTGEKLLQIPADIESQFKTAQTELEAARDTFSQLTARKDALGKEAARLKEQLRSIATIGPETVCDRCHRPYGADLPKIKAHLEAELSQTAAGLAGLESERTAALERGKSLKTRVGELEQKSKERYELTVSQQSQAKERLDVAERLKTSGVQLQRFNEQLRALGETSFDQARFDQLAADLQSLEQTQARANQLIGKASNRPSVEGAIAQNAERISSVETDSQRLTTELAEIGFDQTVFDKLMKDHAEARQALERESNLFTEISKELELKHQELEHRREQMAQLDRQAAELESCRESQFYGEKLSRLFADFRKTLIARIRPRLAELSSQLMSEMTDGRYGMIELDEEYNIQIFDNGHFFGIDRFSGGEKDLANLCLRLAISLALTESAGLSRSFIILDEVFGSQDDLRRDLIMQGLTHLKNRFPQIILITHISELKDKVELPVEVVPTPGGFSEIRIHNGA
jgi:exonuclease SbcC